MSPQADYFEAHEAEYQKRLSNGHVAWDAGGYDEYFMRPFIVRCLERATFRHANKTALDLGCGTGPLACDLARAGFDVLGIDISASAIEFARKAAAERELNITFEVGNVCTRELEPQAYDLIVDGHLLHCIVFADERFDLLVKLRRALRPGGEFWIETMLQRLGHPLNPAWTLDERGVLWTRVRDASNYRQAIQRDGRWWLPQRLIARSEDDLITELTRAGFRIIESETYEPLEPGTPGGYRARCTPLDAIAQLPTRSN